MSQLVVRPGRNAARQAKRLKEVRKVENAIVWHERERKKRQKLYQERHESKQAAIGRMKWENENIKKVTRKALSNAREDWQLGNLRPNRAIGEEEGKYGALTAEQVQKPDIPVHTQKHRNETRERKGLEMESPLVVDDKKYFHIEKNDRVVVINGREKGKIGVVKSIIARTHDVVVTDINKQYYDSNVFNSVGEDMGPKRENEVPMSINDVRLVIPYETTQIVRELNRETGIEEERSNKVFQDVIVDKVHMKRHTTGIDPFTGTDYGANEIPKDHQYDPVSGLPIFHRYIAGTNHRIEWPWEMEKAAEDSQAPEEDSKPKKTWGQTLNPLSLFKRNKEPKASTTTPEVNVVDEYTIARQAHETTRKTRPKSVDPEHMEAWDDVDTTRNIVEQGNDMSYTLIAPPFPDTLSEELRGHAADFNAEARKYFDKDAPRPAKVRAKRSTEQGDIAKEIAKAKHMAAQRMKTPMQLRWETEQAKKVKALKKAPLVSTEELMEALGRHMQVQRKGGKKSEKKVGKVEKIEGVE